MESAHHVTPNPIEKRKIGYSTAFTRDPDILIEIIPLIQSCQYDLIDCAWRYGNEAGIGIALKRIESAHNKKGTIFYFDIPIQSKVWPSQFKGGVNKSLKNCLQKLGSISQIDSYMLHRPHFNTKLTISAWKQLVDCKRLRMAKKIGVGNFDKDLILAFQQANLVLPDHNFMELSVNNMRWDRIKFCHEKKITIQAYKPLGNLSENLNNPLIQAIAKKHQATIPQVLLAYLLHFNIIPIVGSSNHEHIKENIEAKKLFLDQTDIEQLMTLNTYSNQFPETIDIDLVEMEREEQTSINKTTRT